MAGCFLNRLDAFLDEHPTPLPFSRFKHGWQSLLQLDESITA